jgi:hypothetical protein
MEMEMEKILLPHHPYYQERIKMDDEGGQSSLVFIFLSIYLATLTGR